MEIKIESFDRKYWEELKEYINNNWEYNHPLINEELFFWQYKGYGDFSDYSTFKLLIVDGRIGGFRGTIPGMYTYLNSEGKRIMKPGVSFAVWIVNNSLRGKGLGYRLLKSVEDVSLINIAIGSNSKTSVPIYRKNYYSYIDYINRYVMPIDTDGYNKLLSNHIKLEDIKAWVKRQDSDIMSSPIYPDISDLEMLWKNSIKDTNIFGLYRNKEFWQWRYIDSPGFSYLFFGEPLKTGVVVARVEKVCDKSGNYEDDLKVFRIIEIIPLDSNVWNGKFDDDFVSLIKGTLMWARKNKCVAADFHCSTKRLEHILFKCGFKLQNEEYGPEICSLAGMFQPLILKPTVNNLHWKIRNDAGEIVNVSSDDTYFVKSDNDRDRPVLWPVIK